MALSLGNVVFTGFEVPSVVTFGGAQALAVYRLPGGVRVVDALGPDDADIAWRGVLSGANASDRAQALDALRAAGQPIALSWDEFFYSVVISHLQFSFCNSWWIPYEVRCLVVNDPGNVAPTATISILNAVTTDLTAAASFTDVSQAIAAVTAAGSGGAGTAPYTSASAALSATSLAIENSMQASELALMSDDLPTVVSAAGSLATATAARGYIARATANYAQIPF